MSIDVIGGWLEVGSNGKGEVVVNHPDLKPDEHGVGHIVFSPSQARKLAQLLLENAETADREAVLPRATVKSELDNIRRHMDNHPSTAHAAVVGAYERLGLELNDLWGLGAAKK